MSIETFAKKKLSEKNIRWHEEYTPKTFYLKRQYHDVIGPGSYYRFEGRSPDGDEYYVVVGPAGIHKPKAKFFAGVRKMPANYAAKGKEFDSLDSAMRYAHETWGVPIPKSMRPYTNEALFNLLPKIERWKAIEGEEPDDEGGPPKPPPKLISKKKSCTIRFLNKKAMGTEWFRYRQQMPWTPLDDILEGKSETWDFFVENYNIFGLQEAIRDIVSQAEIKINKVAEEYNIPLHIARDINKFFVGFDKVHGLYLISVGPYDNASRAENLADPRKKDARYRFSFFVKSWRSKNEREIKDALKKRLEKINASIDKARGVNYHTRVGLDFSDFSIDVPSDFEAIEGAKKRKIDKKTYSVEEFFANEAEEFLLPKRTSINLNANGIQKLNDHGLLDVNRSDTIEFKLAERGQQIGSQGFSELKNVTESKNILDIKIEILKILTMNGSLIHSPDKILNILLADDKRRHHDSFGKTQSRGAITLDVVNYWLEDIKRDLSSQTVEEVLVDSIKTKVNLTNNLGFDSLRDAFDAASLMFTSTKFDPGVKSKVADENVMEPFLWNDENKNVTSDELKRLSIGESVESEPDGEEGESDIEDDYSDLEDVEDVSVGMEKDKIISDPEVKVIEVDEEDSEDIEKSTKKIDGKQDILSNSLREIRKFADMSKKNNDIRQYNSVIKFLKKWQGE